MAEWLGRVSQGLEMYCHDLEVMGWNPTWVELGVRSTSVYVALHQKFKYKQISTYFGIVSNVHLCIYVHLLYGTIHMYSGITSGRVLDGELLYTKILEVNLFAFANADKLTSRIFVHLLCVLYNE